MIGRTGNACHDHQTHQPFARCRTHHSQEKRFYRHCSERDQNRQHKERANDDEPRVNEVNGRIAECNQAVENDRNQCVIHRPCGESSPQAGGGDKPRRAARQFH